MHELPVTQSLLEIALEYGQKAGARRITDLYLVIGSLASVVDDSVAFYWDILARGTIAEGARLHFQRLPAVLECLDCHTRFELQDGELHPCPQCASMQANILSGDEFRLESIEIEES